MSIGCWQQHYHSSHLISTLHVRVSHLGTDVSDLSRFPHYFFSKCVCLSPRYPPLDTLITHSIFFYSTCVCLSPSYSRHVDYSLYLSFSTLYLYVCQVSTDVTVITHRLRFTFLFEITEASFPVIITNIF